MLIYEMTQFPFITSNCINPAHNLQQDASETTEQDFSSLVSGKPKTNLGDKTKTVKNNLLIINILEQTSKELDE